ncbi:Transcriptional regulator in cluster with unspecified monosaccharide ABC transport system [Streptococcus mitis]|uniref:Transcriptional regulator in cluster with unspecified monosaccharide ABC transport system n=1 Tax=Streptococcus mitis TaxID=28037 RepID=A0A150NJJ4_STRMT|nr:Transcriptional regulator in cluster with unspecified monosaccharide ABC transport system [Streptococcus mitis]
MRKKTIGEVLRLARTNQGLTLEELHKKTEIQLEMLEAMEADDFDQLPSTFYTRSFLRKYAWAVELDERIVLDAYDSGSMITYEEVDVDEEELTGKRRSSKKNKTSFLPLFYFILFALSIVIFVTYYVWNYIQTQPERSSASSYSVVQATSSTSSATPSSTSSSSSSGSSNIEPAITVSGEGNRVEVAYKTSKETAKLQLSVSDARSWVSVSESDLEGGVTLSPDNKSAETSVSTKNSVTITLGVVKGVALTVDNQTVDLSKLTAQTGQITVTFTRN